jgi:hypothetical protein
MTAPDEVAYCTREKVQKALDQADAPRLNSVIDDACRSASRDIEGACHRRFYPVTGIRYPEPYHVSGGVLWLNTRDNEVISLVTVVVDGDTLTEGIDYYLDGEGGGAPYTALRLYSGASRGWSLQPRGNVLTGDFGGSGATADAGALGAAITTTTAVQMTVTNSAVVGVGDLVTVGSERVIVVDKSLATTTATLTGTVAAESSTTTIPVSSGALVNAGEMILVGAERMYVEDVAGNNLIVKRAQNASVLAAHAASDVVYAPRLCQIRRGAAGTTADDHLIGAALVRNLPPSQVSDTALALAENYAEQAKSAYGRLSGAGDNRRASGGTGVTAGIGAAVESLYRAYGRKGRIGVA